MVDNYGISSVYKPTYNWVAPSCLAFKKRLAALRQVFRNFVRSSITDIVAECLFFDRQIDINSVQTRHVTVMCLFLHCGTSDSSKVFTISMTGMMMSLFTGKLFGPDNIFPRASKHHTLTDMHLSV